MRKKQTSRFISLLLGIVLILSMIPTAFAADYNDITENAWHRVAVDYVTENNLMAGTGGGNFEPDTPMTRAMLVTILHRLEGTPPVSGDGGFSDVPDNSYNPAAVTWAADNHIVTGIGNAIFAPNNMITREQFATILHRYANFKGYNTSAFAGFDGYSDATQVSSFAINAMHWALSSQIMQGSSGKLTPGGYATRAQAAVILMRFMETVTEEEAPEPTVPVEPTEPESPVQPEQPISPIPESPRTNDRINVDIIIGNTTFTATLENNDTARAFTAKLPLTMDMYELNGDEKFYNVSDNLREDRSVNPGTIREGDLMLYGDNVLVLFYKTFSTSLSYVKLGRINDTTGLAEAVGSDSVQITFSVSD